jgi:hypothetical protein
MLSDNSRELKTIIRISSSFSLSEKKFLRTVLRLLPNMKSNLNRDTILKKKLDCLKINKNLHFMANDRKKDEHLRVEKKSSHKSSASNLVDFTSS